VKNRSTRAPYPHVLSKPTHIGFKIYAKVHKEAGMYAERYTGQGSRQRLDSRAVKLWEVFLSH